MRPPLSFTRKIVAAALLVALADALFYGEEPGWTLGLFALAWIAGLFAAVPALRRPVPASLLGLAALLALILIDDPNPLAWLLFSAATASAALLPRHRFDDAARWGVRLLAFGFIGLVAPLRDTIRLGRSRRSPHRARMGAVIGVLAVPLIGGTIFLALFAAANPIIEHAFAAIRLPDLSAAIGHLIFWSFVLVAVWATFRPRAPQLPRGDVANGLLPKLPTATLLLSLVTFNAIFAVQNGLDLAFLWTGAPLPSGMSMTEYVHRGAYPLIVTALLAAAFVLVALRPGTASAAHPTVRRLVTLWVGQNVILVVSSALRTLRYIEESMLTQWRIAALVWMALVALGLGLILWRLLRGRSAAWLINTNAAAAALVLLLSTAVDYRAVAARWNVNHARRGDRLDLCYLDSLGSSALLPLIDLERRAGGPVLRDQVRYLRIGTMAALTRDQADWHSWSWRGARRLATARALTASMPTTVRPAPDGRGCDGSINSPAAPLTPEPRP